MTIKHVCPILGPIRRDCAKKGQPWYYCGSARSTSHKLRCCAPPCIHASPRLESLALDALSAVSSLALSRMAQLYSPRMTFMILK